MNNQGPLLSLKVQFRHPKNVQQEGLIREIQPCQVTLLKTILFIIGSICTAGLLYLLSRWDLRVFVFCRAKKCSPLRATHFIIHGQDRSQTLVRPIKQQGTIFLEYRLYRYAYTTLFEPIETLYQARTCKDISSDLQIDRNLQYERFGANTTEIPDKGILVTLIEEVLSPFYIFQFCSVLLWFWAEYQRYATVILLTSLISIAITLREQRRSFHRLQELSKFQIPVQVMVGDVLTTMSSNEIVPGDRVVIEDGMTMPCDFILLNGQAIVNEAMLTGEAIPVLKTPLPNSPNPYDPKDEGKQCTLFAGTTCLETKLPNKATEKVFALATQTSFNTMKGQLIRSIMFPVESSFKFYADSMKFIGVMAFLAVIGFAVTVPSKIGYLLDDSISYWEFINEGLDLITITVPPALPTCLQIGVSIALTRLQRKSVFCISPPKVNISGKVTVMCFDKTGTLTEEGLDMYGMRTVGYQQKQLRFSQLFNECEELVRDSTLSFDQLINKENGSVCGIAFAEVMASCHGLAWVKGQIIGDPLEIKMFEATGWTLLEDSQYLCTVKPKGRVYSSVVSMQPYCEDLHIVRRFEFSSKLQRMSVIVQRGTELLAHIKGSPEKLRELCLPSSIPSNFHQILEMYALNGFRVLAIGSKRVNSIELERGDVERDLHFLGFVVMENKLKPITTPVIQQLHDAHIRTIMVTGDNVLTAISVARQCGIINHQRVYLGELSEKKVNGKYFVQWKDFEHNQNQLNSESLDPEGDLIADEVISDVELLEEEQHIKHRRSVQMEDYTSLLKNKSLLEEPPPKEQDMRLSLIYTDGDFTEEQPWDEQENYVLAISGGAFTHIYQNGSQATLNNILEKSLIYARMRPEEKANLMLQLQKSKRNPLVGFCGDGANDCGALKSADIGVSLSAAEASIAAPFTSTVQDISCIPELLRQGRAALTTSFTCFKFMALYSMIQFSQVTILYLKQSNLTDNQYLYNDLFTIFPLSMTMGFTEASQLNRCVPGSTLISLAVLGSVIGQTIIQVAFQLFVYVMLLRQDWFMSAEEINANNLNDDTMKVCFENTTLFLFGNFQYIANAIAFSNGRPFRKSFYTNYWFLGSLTTLLSFGLIFMFWRNPTLDDIMGFKFDAIQDGQLIAQMPESWVYFLGIVAIINSILTLLFERIIVPIISSAGKQKVDPK